MSRIEDLAGQITKESNPEVATWAKYEAALAQFEDLRKKHIDQIMNMQINEGDEFFDKLQNKIKEFKRS